MLSSITGFPGIELFTGKGGLQFIKIENKLFYRCDSLTKLVIPNSLPEFKKNFFILKMALL